MDITQQQYIIALAETGSVTNAARQLGISQPALSSWLKNIESQLGAELVIRSKKNLVLTPAGKIYLEGARKMIAIKNQTYRTIFELSGVSRKTIIITGTPNGGAELFSRLFQDFQNKFPATNLQFIESYNNESLQMVREGSADIGICSSLELESGPLEFIHTADSELILMVPYGFPTAYDSSALKKDAEFPPAFFPDLEGLPFIMPSPAMSYYTGLTQIFQKIGFRPNVIFQSANVKIIYSMVKSGNGAAVLPRRLFSPLDEVSPFSLEPKLISHAVIVHRRGVPLTPAHQYIIDFIRKSSPRPL